MLIYPRLEYETEMINFFKVMFIVTGNLQADDKAEELRNISRKCKFIQRMSKSSQ